jgi:DNA-binding NarL/FixJ family response regulator
MAQAAEQLVGRPTELGVFDGILAELEQGGSAAIELVGEPGIGKTRLLSELADRADARGDLVLSGSASELERDLPFWVFVDALDEYAEGLDPRRIAHLDDQTRAELAHVFPSLSALDGGAAVGLQDERYRTHRAVRELLEVLASTQPLILILDDLHWADSGSIELLGALLRSPPAAAVLLATASRPRQTPDRLSAALERAHRSGRLVRLELGALTLGEAHELVGLGVDTTVTNKLYEEAGGNPFYLEQLVRSLDRATVATPAIADLSLVDVEVPPAVVAALAEELGLLSDGGRRILEGAAVAGDPFEPELVAAAAGVTEVTAIEALDELLRSDLIRPTDVPRRFRFRHPLVRRAVYDSSPGGWRIGAHQRSAEALTARGASAAARAHHVERSAPHGDRTAVALLREAGDESAQRTPASAARWFGAALRLLGEGAPPEDRVELLTALAGAQAATGQFTEAHAALLESMELLPPDSIAQVRLTAACAGLEQLLGRHQEAHARLEGALRALDDSASPQAAALMVNLALDAFFRQEFADSRAWGERALKVARPLGDLPLTAAAVAMVALACAFVEAIEEAEIHSTEAARLIDAMPDAQLAMRLDAIAYLTGAETYVDRFEAATAHGLRGLTIARATGQGALLPMLIQALSTALAVQGRLVEAAEILDGAIEGARLAGNDQTLAWDLLNRAFVGVQLGEVDTAVAAAEESVHLTRELDESFISMYTGVLLAIARMESGNPEAAAQLFVASGGGEAMPLVPGGWRAKYLELLTRCWLLLGRRADAEKAAAAAHAVAEATGLRTAAAWADRAAAFVALDSGDYATAVARALASAAAADDAGGAVEAAVSRTLAGRALALAGEHERAVAELELAVAVLDAASCDRFRLEAERELGKLGHRTHRRTRPGKTEGTGVDSLTQRELELARLIVDRKTNPEIAATLFLSQKTVETHLRNMFRKLSVTSRVELARAVEQADRAGESF